MSELATSFGGAIPPVMKAMRVHEFGGADVIRAERIPVPEPGPGEVLVRVHAAGVGPWDGWIRSGNSVLPQPLPLTLGSDVAGEIVSAGRDVSGLYAGDAVYGVTNKRFTDGYAEFAICLAGMIAAKPARLSFVEAASVPVIAATAYQALFDHGAASNGQSVLVHGAAGNVGRFAVQLARIAGLHVVAGVRGDDSQELAALGADVVLDGRSGAEAPVDLAIDLVGGDSQRRLFDSIKPGGRLVSAVSEPDAEVAREREVKAGFMLVDVTSEVLTRLSTMFDEGALVARVGSVLPLDDAVRAHEMLEGRSSPSPGKIVLSVPR